MVKFLRSTGQESWQAKRLMAAPHRLAFFTAALPLAATGWWWCLQLVTRASGYLIPWVLAPGTAHGIVMSLGFMPMFFAGFLFTAGPKWLHMPEVSARTLLPHVLTTLIGWTLCLIGFHWHRWLCALGMLLVSAAWSGLVLKFYGLWRHSPNPDRTHASLILASSAIGAICMFVIAAGLFLGWDKQIRAATQAGLWFFISCVFAAVSHRMIPFFSASAVPSLDAWRPMWLLWVMVGVLWTEGAATCLELLGVHLGTAVRCMQIAMESCFGLLMLWLAIRWGLVQSLKIRLLAMLHGGFLWLGIAMALQALSHVLMLLSDGEISLGLAPLHALTTGYLGATLFAMATRVSSGHSGRPLAADGIAWWLYWVLQAAAFTRVVSALWPATGMALLLMSVSLWTVATSGWFVRYGSWFGRPRLDGRPG